MNDTPLCYLMKNSPIYDPEGCHGADDCCDYHPYKQCHNPQCDYKPYASYKCQGLKELINGQK